MRCTRGYRFSLGGGGRGPDHLLHHCFETSQPKWLLCSYKKKKKKKKKAPLLKGKNSFPITPIKYRGHCGQNEWD